MRYKIYKILNVTQAKSYKQFQVSPHTGIQLDI